MLKCKLEDWIEAISEMTPSPGFNNRVSIWDSGEAPIPDRCLNIEANAGRVPKNRADTVLAAALCEFGQAGQGLDSTTFDDRLHLALKLLVDEAVGRKHIAAAGDVKFASIHVGDLAAGLFHQQNAGRGVPRI